MKVPGSEPLRNAKWERLAQARAKGQTLEKSQIEAGFAPDKCAATASRLIKKPQVSERIDFLKSEADQLRDKAVAAIKATSLTTRVWVLEELRDNAMKAKAAVPVLDNKGNPTGEWRADFGASNQALKLIGMELGMFVERKEVRHGRLDDVTDDKLREITQAALVEAGMVIDGQFVLVPEKIEAMERRDGDDAA